MEKGIIDIRVFLGGLSLFLYGMFLFQYSIRKLGSRYLKKVLRKWTNTPFKGLLVGVFSTSVLQSSSVVSLIVLGFIGAGILTFESSIGVIVGTNIGATITGWIIGVLGFSTNLETIALPIIAVTGILMFILKDKKKIYFTLLFIFGFGILLFGLNFMKGSISLGSGFDLQAYINFPIILFVLIGIILTALVQSTAVCNTIVFTALYSGAISFEIAAMIIIGSNIGTTVTTILGSLGGTSNQKQITGIHVLYNLITTILVLAIFKPIIYFINNILNLNGVIGLAAFHTIFNIIGAIVFFPLLKQASKLIKKIIPDKQSNFRLKIMDISPNSGSTAIFAIKEDIDKLCHLVMSSNLSLFHIKPQKILQKEAKIIEALKENYNINEKTFDKNYELIKKLESNLINFCLQFESLQEKTNSEQLENLGSLNKAIMNMTQSTKMMKDVKNHIEELYYSDKKILKEQFDYFKKRITKFFSAVYIVINEEKYNNTAIEEIGNKLKDNDKSYLEIINKHFNEKNIWGNIKSILFSKNLEESEFSDLIFINNYIYNSCQLFIEGIKEWKVSKTKDNKILPDTINNDKQENKKIII